MKNLYNKITWIACMFVALLTSAHAAETTLYKSAFPRGIEEWAGRPSWDAVPPEVSAAKVDGVQSVHVRTDGHLGSGLQWTCPVDLKVGVSYKLSFRIKKSSTELVTFRITDAAGTGTGDEGKAWHAVAYSEQDLGNWVRVNLVFTPTTPTIGFAIGAAVDHADFPYEIWISDLTISKF